MSNTVAAALAVAPLALAGQAAADVLSVERSGKFHVDVPPEDAFPLFTAPGERLWVPGWDPVILGGWDGLERGTVWLTGDGEDRTIWLVVDYDPESFHARYARITPASRAFLYRYSRSP